MDQSVRKWMEKEILVGRWKMRGAELLFLTALTALAVLVRVQVRSFVADDWSIYWSSWLLEFQTRGFSALAV